MARKRVYVVILFSRSQQIQSVFGTFSDKESADCFGRASDASRYGVWELRSPWQFAFAELTPPPPKPGGVRYY